MKVNLIKIGNSQGIRIPKSLIEQCGLDDAIELEVKDGALLLRPAKPNRQGWEKAFAEAENDHDGPLLPGGLSEEWDDKEWTW